MSLKNKRAILIVLWLLVVLSGPVTVLLHTDLSLLSENLHLLSTLQRMTGLVAYSLLVVQILLGAFLGKWLQAAGSKAYRIHIVQGVLTYIFLFSHPVFQSLIDFEVAGKFSSFLIPRYDSMTEIYQNYGRAAFGLFTVSIFAGYFRTKPLLRKHWRVFHVLNYLAFYSVFIHARFIGSDVFTPPFVYVFYSGFAAVTIATFYRLYVYLSGKFAQAKLEKESTVEQNTQG